MTQPPLVQSQPAPAVHTAAPPVKPKIMFTDQNLEHFLTHSWVEEAKGEHLCQNCKTLFMAAHVLACKMEGRKFNHTIFFCPECAKEVLGRVISRYKKLHSAQETTFQKTKPIYEMTPAELAQAFKKLPAKTLLGFFRKALVDRYGTSQAGWRPGDDKVAALPDEVQQLIAGSSPAIVQAAFEACRYSAFEPDLFARLLLAVFRARSKRNLKDQLKLPAKTPPQLIEETLLKLKPVSRLRILKQLETRLPNLEKLIFPLLMHRTLRTEATSVLKELAERYNLDDSRIAAALKDTV